MTHKQKLEQLLSDGNWHDSRELNDVCFRYSARLNEMKKDGYEWEKRQVKKGLWEYRQVEETPTMTNEDFNQWVDRRMEDADREERVQAGFEPQQELF